MMVSNVLFLWSIFGPNFSTVLRFGLNESIVLCFSLNESIVLCFGQNCSTIQIDQRLLVFVFIYIFQNRKQNRNRNRNRNIYFALTVWSKTILLLDEKMKYLRTILPLNGRGTRLQNGQQN